MTPAAMMITLAGLSHREAAEFLGIRLDTVQSYFRRTGAKSAPTGMLNELRRLIALQQRAADETLTLIANKMEATKAAGDVLSEIDIGFPADDYEAQALGFPCVGAWQAMAARVVAGSAVPIRLVPRGTNPATAGATDIHER